MGFQRRPCRLGTAAEDAVCSISMMINKEAGSGIMNVAVYETPHGLYSSLLSKFWDRHVPPHPVSEVPSFKRQTNDSGQR